MVLGIYHLPFFSLCLSVYVLLHADKVLLRDKLCIKYGLKGQNTDVIVKQIVGEWNYNDQCILVTSVVITCRNI